MATKKQTVWETLSSDKEYKNHTEEKQAGKITLTYLSWAWAWNFVKKHYPSAKFTKHLFEVSSDDATYTVDNEPAPINQKEKDNTILESLARS